MPPLILLVLALVLAGCDDDDFFSGSGQVTRCGSAEPLAGVRITLRSGRTEHVVFSDARGVFSTNLGISADATVELEAYKPGFERHRGTLEGEKLAPVTFCLTQLRPDDSQ